VTEPELPVEPFSVSISEQVLADLQARIRRTRWPDPAPGAGWEQGTDRGYLRELLGYWAEQFDWRAAERELNASGISAPRSTGPSSTSSTSRPAAGRGYR
jgi:hypothetical protein